MTHLRLYIFILTTIALMGLQPLCADNCIDFTHLSDTGVCTCYHGRFAHPTDSIGAINYGPDDIRSRHTVHTNVSETDPRTGGMLRTIPLGDTASVRLGNWKAQTLGEAIEYVFTPSADDGDMLVLKYAAVLDNPNKGHTANEKPRFALQILDRNGNQITGPSGCYEADFTVGENATTNTGWTHYTYTEAGQTKNIYWKDWTTVFFPLQDYIGQQVRIRLITKDCAHKSHFGYAYFTIHCQKAQLQGLSCDGLNNHFEAPQGYTYRWYKKNNPNEVLYNPDGSLKPVDRYDFDLNPGDFNIYCVNIYSETGCFITLEANPIRLHPVAQIREHGRTTADCHYTISFANETYTQIVNGDNIEIGHFNDNPRNHTIWHWGDGSPDETDNMPFVTHTFMPGDYDVRVNVILEEGCEDSTFLHLSLPEFLSSVTAQQEYIICPEDSLFIHFQIDDSHYEAMQVIPDQAARNAGFEDYYTFPACGTEGTLALPLPGADKPIAERLRAGTYTFTLRTLSHSGCRAPDLYPITVHVTYPREAMLQRGSYLFLRNEQFNGGYDWTHATFQWYRNGEPLDGKTSSQLLMTDTLPGTEYYCVITGPDGTRVSTCPLVYTEPQFTALTQLRAQSNDAICAQPGQPLLLSGEGTAAVYDATGRLLFAAPLQHLHAPMTAGFYLIRTHHSTIRLTVNAPL